MKNIWKTVFMAKVNSALFGLMCLALGTVLLTAKLMADDISRTFDDGLERLTHPAVVR